LSSYVIVGLLCIIAITICALDERFIVKAVQSTTCAIDIVTTWRTMFPFSGDNTHPKVSCKLLKVCFLGHTVRSFVF